MGKSYTAHSSGYLILFKSERNSEGSLQMNKLQMQWLVFGALFSSLPAGAATFCVNPAGTNGCVKTIGAAVTSAVAGDTINVAPGTYKESVTIGKGITLLGTDPATTTIDATGLP